MGQLLAHSFQPPKWHDDYDVYEYMVMDFVEAVRNCLKSGGFATREKEAEAGGTFLVGFKGRLFEIADDYQVGESVSNFAACGCGHELALGSFFSTPKMKAVDRVRLALEAAERSEEHTSELQSLMRISYAVFCLKKKKHTQDIIRL